MTIMAVLLLLIAIGSRADATCFPPVMRLLRGVAQQGDVIAKSDTPATGFKALVWPTARLHHQSRGGTRG